MPAGDLVVADYQLELRTTLMGAGTSYKIGPQGIAGLGEPNVKTSDTELAHADGSYLGRDYLEPRTITVDFSLVASTPAAAGVLLVNLKTVWAKSEATDLALHFRLPGIGKKVVTGRPRGLVEDTTAIKFGFVRALATFYCGNPTISAA